MYNKPFSYSGLSLYKECPLKWKASYIDGYVQPPSQWTSRGVEKHQKLEAFFKGQAPYPSGDNTLRPWQPVYEALMLREPKSELQLAVDADWLLVEFDSPMAVFRGVVDLTYEIGGIRHIVDFKTGREYESHVEQGMAYLSLMPEQALVCVEMHYLDNPRYIKQWQYIPTHREIHIDHLRQEMAVARVDETYDPTPSYNGCKYCHLSWRMGGVCTRAP